MRSSRGAGNQGQGSRPGAQDQGTEMRRSFRVIAVIGGACAVLFSPVRQSHAWGPGAHRTIALIADKFLQQNAAAVRGKVQAVLATDKDNRLTKNDIASEGTWADVLRDKSQ